MTPGAIDPRVVRRHLLELRRVIGELKRHRGRPLAILAEPDELWAVERGLQLAAQNALDIATHLVAGVGRDVPDYATAIDLLADLEVLEPDFAAGFRSVAGFRNVLVHGYLEVDLEILHDVLNKRLEEFLAFAESVERYLGGR